MTAPYRLFIYLLFCGLIVALAEIYKNWMVMLQYNEPSIMLVSSVIWEYMSYAFIAILFPWSWRRVTNKIIWKWIYVSLTAILYSILYVSVLSIIEWFEFNRNYALLNGLKFSFFHLPYVLVAYSIISYLVFSLSMTAGKITKYQNIKMSNAESEHIYNQLLSLLINQQYYLRSGFKISEISKRLDIPVNKVSRSINENFGGSFSDLVNHHRIDHAKKILSNPENIDKLYAIALDSGFNNKVSFHQQFKKFTGISPQKYRDQQLAHVRRMKVS
ncbi:MAG: AraC family transcriptional regulator [Cyclobacteriaceae bacterium]